jgi:hypothetical protein
MIWADHDAVQVANEGMDVLAYAQSDWPHRALKSSGAGDCLGGIV